MGNFTNWIGCYGIFDFFGDPPKPVIRPCLTQGFSPTRHVIKQGPGYYDHFSCDSLITVFPGESYSARLGDTTGGGHAEQLKYTINVSDSNYLFVYRYAVVLESPNHAINEQPGFTVALTNMAGTILDSTCGYYEFYAPNTTSPPYPAGWHYCSAGQSGTQYGIYWKDWTTVGMNLTPYTNQQIQIVFTTHGCCYQAHRGYAYISTYCSQLEIQTSLCEGQDTAVITAPPGFSYYWLAITGDPSINGDTTASIRIPSVEGASYQCTLTAANGCQVDISNVLHYTRISTGFIETLNCAERPSSFTDTTWVSQNDVTAWRWFFGDPASGAADSSNLENPTHSYTAPGNYTVTLISYSTDGCSDTTSKNLTIGPLPDISNTSYSKILCSHDSTDITITSNISGTLFTWTATATSPAITGFSDQVIPVSYLNQHLLNSGNQIDTVIYNVVPQSSSCAGDDTNFYIAVYPHPNLTNAVLVKSICDSSWTNITLQSNLDTTRFTWICTTSSLNVTGFSSNPTTPDTIIDQLLRNSGNTIDTVYYHVLPHAFGCLGDSTIYKVAVYPVPHISNASLSKTICDSTLTGIILTSDVFGTTFTWTCTPSSGNITGWSNNNTGTTTLDQRLDNTGTAIETVTYHLLPMANGCNGPSRDYIITIRPTPVPVITGNASVCAGSVGIVYSTQAGMTGYTWNISAGGTVTGGGTANDNSVTVTWNTPGAQTVTVNFTDLVGCPALAPCIYPVTVHPLPVPVISGTASVCINSSTVYTTAPGMTGYIWTVSAGGNITAGAGTNSITVNWTTNGAQNITVNYTDSFGCTATTPTAYNVNVTTLPVPGLVGANSVCVGNSEVYSTDPSMSNYVWVISAGGSVTAGGGPADNTVTVHWTISGSQTVSVNYQAGPGCTSPSPTTLPVTVRPLPVPAIAGLNGVCVGSTGIIYSTLSGMSGYSWSISAGGTITAGGTALDNTVTVTWNTAGAQNVSVNYTDLFGCTALTPSVYAVTVHPLPVPAIAGLTGVCAGSTGIIYTTLPGQTNYLWTVSGGGTITGGGTSTDNTVTVTWNTPGAQTVTVNYHDLNGCMAVTPTSYAVTVYILPVPLVGGSNKICAGTTGVVYTTQPGMTNYTWTVSAGGTVTGGGSAADNTITVTWNMPGAQTVSVNFHDLNNCTAVASTIYPVTVDPLPVPTISGNNNLCAGTAGIVYSTQPGMNNYSWSVSAGGTITTGAGTSAVTVTWNTAGAQTVSVNYLDLNGCTATSPFSYPVTVQPLPVPAIAGPSALCTGTTGAIYSTQPGKTNYQWTVSGGGTITAGGTAADNTVTVTWNTPGARSVSVNYNDINGCTALTPASYSVTVNPLPVPGISGAPGVCLNSTSNYLTEAGMTGYIWTVSAGGTITAGAGTNSITVQWNTTGTKTIQVNYYDSNGCTATSATSYSVNVNVLPVPSLTGLNSICSGLTTVYTTDPGMNNYSWAVSSGGSITAGGGPNDNTATVLWNTAGGQTVSINYFMGTGCTAALPTVYNVTVKPRPSVTNAANSSMCSNGTTNIVPAASLPLTTFSWTATGSSGSVTGFNPGAGTSITDNLVNTGFNVETVNYAVTPSLNGCDGPVAHYIVTVFPVADVYFNPNGQSFCSGGTANISLLSHVAGATFTWTVTGSSGYVSGYLPGNGTSIVQTLTNSGPYFENVNYDVLPVANSCIGTNSHVIVNLNPTPAVSFNLACNDVITTTDGKPFTLKGGIPIGGVFSGAGITAGIFYPNLAGVGIHTISYSYSNTWGCNASSSQTISVSGAVPFPCDNILTDIRDSKQYPTVKLGTQCWMAQNLDIGTQVPSTAMQRDNCVIEKYCYNDLAVNCTSMGGLYQWDEMMRFEDAPAIQGICPPGWHIPTENDWATLFNFYISNGFAASPLKYDGYSGFNAFLDGVRFHNSNWNFSNFATFFWSSTSHGPVKAWAHAMNTFDPSVSYYPGNRSNAFSLRCIKD